MNKIKSLLRRILRRILRRSPSIRGDEDYRREVDEYFQRLVTEGPERDIVELVGQSVEKLTQKVQASINVEAIQNYLALSRRQWVPKIYRHQKLAKYPSVERFVGGWWLTDDGLALSRRMIFKGLPKAFLDRRGEMTALDIGCGGGRLLKEFSRDFKELHGIDVSSQMVKFAQEHLRQGSIENVHPVTGDGFTLLVYPEAKFDFVYSTISFEHIKTLSVLKVYYAEIYRVLRRGGWFSIQTFWQPGKRLPSSFEATTDTLEVNKDDLTDWPQGINLNPCEVEALFRDAGFSTIQNLIVRRADRTWRIGDSDPSEVANPSSGEDVWIWTFGTKD